MRTSNCCGCFSLRTGALAIGGTLLALHALSAVAVAGYLVHQSIHFSDDTEPLFIVPFYVFTALGLLFNALLVHGARSSSIGLLHAWAVYQRIFVAVSGAAVGICFVFACVQESVPLLVATLLLLPVVATMWYCYVVVHSFFDEVRVGSGLTRSPSGAAIL